MKPSRLKGYLKEGRIIIQDGKEYKLSYGSLCRHVNGMWGVTRDLLYPTKCKVKRKSKPKKLKPRKPKWVSLFNIAYERASNWARDKCCVKSDIKDGNHYTFVWIGGCGRRVECREAASILYGASLAYSQGLLDGKRFWKSCQKSFDKQKGK